MSPRRITPEGMTSDYSMANIGSTKGRVWPGRVMDPRMGLLVSEGDGAGHWVALIALRAAGRRLDCL